MIFFVLNGYFIESSGAGVRERVGMTEETVKKTFTAFSQGDTI